MAPASSIASVVSNQLAGFDTVAAVKGILTPQQFEIDQLKQRQTDITAKQDLLNQFNTDLQALRSTAAAMADSGSFFSYTASLSSNNPAEPASNILSISGTNSVSAGSHSIVVDQIALATRFSSSGAVTDSTPTAATSDTSPLNLSGSFQIKDLAGTTLLGTVNIGVADSLQDIVATINQLNTGNAKTGVTASIVKVATNDYRLILNADNTGTAKAFSIATITGGAANLNLTSSQTALDSKVTIDGIQIVRDSNSVSDGLPGVTIDLKQASTTKVTLDIGVDTAALQTNVQSFIDGYNKVMGFINTQYKFDSATGKNGLLASNPLLGSIQSALSSSLMSTVPGLAADRNTMVSIGVEPDAAGVLSINPALFDNFMNNSPNAVRDVFIANGSSNDSNLQFLLNGTNTPSGIYNVNITQAATKAIAKGSSTTFSDVGATTNTITITDTVGKGVATIALTSGLTQGQIISNLNTAFSQSLTEVRQLSAALSGGAATGATTLQSLGMAVNDTITIGGTDRLGIAVNSTFTMLSTSDTLSDLTSAIQTAFGQTVTSSVDNGGHIIIADSTAGASQLTLSLTASSSPTVDFGTDSASAGTVEGRYAMNVVAVADPTTIGAVAIEAANFGSSTSYTIAETGSASTWFLGLAATSTNGTNVAGTISGQAATGLGQLLAGTAGNPNGMGLLYTGTANTFSADITVGVGIGAAYNGLLDTFSNSFSGLVVTSVQSQQTEYDDLTARIATLQSHLDIKRSTLTKSFTQMQQLLTTLQKTGDFLTAQTNAQRANN